MIAGRYALEREIGRGGMGAVWLGRDQVLGRRVALKRIGLVPGTDGPDLERVEREARVSAELQHPNVVAVFDLAEEAGEHWLVMEYVEGSTLSGLVQRTGRLDADTAAPLLRQVTDALSAAHAAGIVHRDVKPSNILVDREGVAKLSDFGIARRDGDASLTQTGLLIGSPTYLAPEVASGQRGTAAADVWSFGATMFYAVTGAPPYEVDDNVLSTLYRIIHEDPPTPHGAGWLTPAIEGMLRKDPVERWSLPRLREFLLHGGERTPIAAQPEPARSAGARPGPIPAGLTPGSTVAPEPDPTTPIRPMAGRPGSGAHDQAPVRPRRGRLLLGTVLVIAIALALGLGYALLGGSGADPDDPPQSAGSATPSPKAIPTAAGMEAFIRDYVSTVAEDPDRAWTMLTAKFQRESGGIATYRKFWRPAAAGRVLDISANPDQLSVSYHVHFDNFDNGPGPTVLDLAFEGGTYLIDGERTQGFVPAD